MSTGTKLIISAIVFLIYGGVAIYSGFLPGSAHDNEQHLQAAAEKKIAAALLGDARLSGVRVEMDGQLAKLTGTIASQDVRQSAIDLVRGSDWSGGITAGGVTVVRADNLTVQAPTAPAPFIWAADFDGREVILSGVVPDEISRSELITHAQERFEAAFSGQAITVIDRMSTAPGAPAGDWLGTAKLSIDGLAHLQRGKASANNTAFSLTGLALVEKNKTDAQADIAILPEGYIGTSKISLAEPKSPYVWNASLNNDQSPVVLTGYVPDEATREQVVAHAKSLFPQGIVDQMTIASGMPAGSDKGYWPNSIMRSLDALALYQSGKIVARDRDVTVTGRGDDPALIDRVAAIEADIDRAGYNGALSVDIPEVKTIDDADQCQNLFDDAMRDTSIRFQNASAEILPESARVLSKLALAARQCDGFKITIAGHTDSVGSAALNQSLSEARARAVVAWLVENGADTEQMTARGFGETKPIANNQTPAGRARNRRIDFSIDQ